MRERERWPSLYILQRESLSQGVEKEYMISKRLFKIRL